MTVSRDQVIGAVSRYLRPGCAALLLLTATGCAESTIQEYGPFTRDLDGENELHISTYPAGLPRVTDRVPYLFKAQKTPDEVYFQVFVRDRSVGAGPNPHIESIHIESFSYRFPGQAPVILLEDYAENFWMQGNPRYESETSPPVPFNEHWYLQIQIDLTVNGTDYSFDERIDASLRNYLRPLILDGL